MKLEFGLTLTFIVLASTSELPSDFKICRRSDPNLAACFNEAGQKATIFLANGLKSLEVPPIEPLAIERMTVGETHGVVALKQDFRNIKLHGLTKGLKVTGYNIDFDKLVFKSLSFNPEISFDADYTIDGRLLLLPIRGNGKANITMYNMKSTNTYYGEKFEKNGEIYMKIKKFLVKLSPEKIHLHFSNLFNGDKLLGNQMNKFLNANSDLLFNEMRAPYEETFGNVFTKIANDVFSKVPFNKIFPE
ncbi:hypothetical protein PV328_000883 [Microctonus aethiopoides]|uniref:Protein takeout n=1 Tax=Microctonus aethiopoides TaxID=144406 RepID=A0AA39FW17_9HYME|nr:hypothetical protein PV328_000883 [Microctonus aethiopoides]